MGKKELTVWGSALIIIAIVCAVYFHYKSSENEPPPTEPNIVQPINQTDTPFGITKAMKGEFVSVRANVVSITSGKGHFFPILKDPVTQKTIKGVLFKDDAEEEPNRKELLEKRRKDGELLSIDGIVGVHEGELEIIIKKVY